MPRLTRTQKFAELREQLTNDKEELINTQELSKFQDRLNNVQDILSPAPEKKLEEELDELWVPFVEPNVEEPVFNQLKENIEAVVNDQLEVKSPSEETPIDEFPAFVETVVETPVEELPVFEQPVVEEPVSIETFEETPVEEPVVEQPQENVETPVEELPVFEQPVVEEPRNESSYFDSFMDGDSNTNASDDFNSYFEDSTKEVVDLPIDEIYSDVFEDVQDESGEIVSIKERDTYLGQTITDVNSYNINNGQTTIDQIVDNSVDEVRHPENVVEAEFVEEVVEEQPVVEEQTVKEEVKEEQDNGFAWTPFTEQEVELDADKLQEEAQIDDEEFSNTVSMEITKIMDEIANAPEQVIEPEVAIPVVEELVDEVKEESVINDTIVEEKPEDVVEIKNIAEIDEESVKDTISSTIPFIVAAEDEELIEEDEEDGSNTVLNVILIVLIVVLVAVLGLIVFYILKTKGIF